MPNFTILVQNYLPFKWGGHEIYNFFSPYPTDATYQTNSIIHLQKQLKLYN